MCNRFRGCPHEFVLSSEYTCDRREYIAGNGPGVEVRVSWSVRSDGSTVDFFVEFTDMVRSSEWPGDSGALKSVPELVSRLHDGLWVEFVEMVCCTCAVRFVLSVSVCSVDCTGRWHWDEFGVGYGE